MLLKGIVEEVEIREGGYYKFRKCLIFIQTFFYECTPHD